MLATVPMVGPSDCKHCRAIVFFESEPGFNGIFLFYSLWAFAITYTLITGYWWVLLTWSLWRGYRVYRQALGPLVYMSG